MPEGVIAGLTFGNHEGLKTDGKTVSYTKGDHSSVYHAMRSASWGGRSTDVPVKTKGHVYLKIRNYRQDLSFYSSDDGEHWTTFQNGVRSGNHTIRLFAARAEDRSTRKIKKASFSHFNTSDWSSSVVTPGGSANEKTQRGRAPRPPYSVFLGSRAHPARMRR